MINLPVDYRGLSIINFEMEIPNATNIYAVLILSHAVIVWRHKSKSGPHLASGELTVFYQKQVCAKSF